MEDVLLKITATLLVIIVILIFIQYISIIKQKTNNNSSQTINTVEENEEVIHTKVNNNSNNNLERDLLIKNITNKLKEKLDIENFEDTVSCSADVTQNIFYLYLTTAQLEGVKYTPTPIWSNDTFCVYKVNKILSLNDEISTDKTIESDYYYSLGDIILIKDYDKYLKDYSNNLVLYNQKVSAECKTNSSNNNVKNTKTEAFSNIYEYFEQAVPKPDNHISNYDQPGLQGLKMLIKNGKKPIGFEPRPVCVITKSNGNNLYAWRPIPPQGYMCLGDVCNFGPTPNQPQVDTCHIRAVPMECLDNVSLGNMSVLLSKDIEKPYKINLVSNQKYFQGVVELGLGEVTQSYDLNGKCQNVERDNDDVEQIISINILNSNGKGEESSNSLESYEINSFKTDYEIAIENKLLNTESLKLNNVLNNKNMESVFNKKDMRFSISVNSFVKNKIMLKITWKKRALAYTEITTDKIVDMLEDNLKEILTVSIPHNGNSYTFEPLDITVIESSEVSKKDVNLDALNIDSQLRKELSSLGKLAVRNKDIDINLKNLVDLDLEFPNSISNINKPIIKTPASSECLAPGGCPA